ncbi:MAG: Crp/Fnr family transcriptional regulator [Deltaproteobacteria bacterium]|nr:Crp/Fnr family transcriptional regulator [Deltaproteobacteria bacterium]
MEKILIRISESHLFSGLSESQLLGIKNISAEMHYEKGQIIFSDGEDSNGFFLVVEGTVKVFKISVQGKEQTLHLLGPGEPFGQVAVFTGKPFPANAEAITSVRLLFFPRDAFIDLISRNVSLSLNMLASLSMRLQQFTVLIENLSLKEVHGRLAAYLLYLSAEQGSENSVELDISKGQLSSILGTIPETLSRVFSKLAARKLIEVNGPKIRLINRSELEELAGS